MEIAKDVSVKTVARPFDNTLSLLRRDLEDAGLTVVHLAGASNAVPSGIATGSRDSALLLVDCPLLFFEAVALDRSAAAYVPLHVVVIGDQYSSCIYWAHPAESIGLRLQPAAKEAVETLYARITQVLRQADTWGGQRGNHRTRRRGARAN